MEEPRLEELLTTSSCCQRQRASWRAWSNGHSSWTVDHREYRQTSSLQYEFSCVSRVHLIERTVGHILPKDKWRASLLSSYKRLLETRYSHWRLKVKKIFLTRMRSVVCFQVRTLVVRFSASSKVTLIRSLPLDWTPSFGTTKQFWRNYLLLIKTTRFCWRWWCCCCPNNISLSKQMMASVRLVNSSSLIIEVTGR